MTHEFAFLFGAGASKALGNHVTPYAPPLMYELYDGLAKVFPSQWGDGTDFAKYSAQFKSDFEQTFTEVVLGMTQDYSLPGPSLSLLELQRPLAQYFSQFVLDDTRADCYSRLLDALRTSRKIAKTVSGSLNYDCLFEQAANHSGLRVDYPCATQAADTACVAKLHGSANFVGEIDQTYRAILAGTMVHVEVSRIIELSVDGLEQQLSHKFQDVTMTYLPVMSQVSHFKELLLAPARIQEMRNAWTTAVQGAKFVVIIGVSYNAHDSHIFEPIGNASGRVLYIGDDTNFVKWRIVNACTEHIADRFEVGLNDLLACLTLSIPR